MQKKSTIILKALLDRSSQKEALFTYFPKALQQELRALPLYPFFNFNTLLQETSDLKEIHYSWFKEFFEKMADGTKTLFLSVFEKEEREKLQKLIGYTVPLSSPLPFLQPLLAAHLKSAIQDKEILPPQCLTQNQMHILLEIGKVNLLQLIDFLGIYDLAADLRQIVDKSVLSSIASCLTEKQRTFLQYATKQSLRYLPARLNLREINGDKVRLNKLLHKRGLDRLGGALCFEDKDFLWHFLHKLDTGRARAITKIMEEPPEERIVKFFKRQVIALATRLK